MMRRFIPASALLFCVFLASCAVSSDVVGNASTAPIHVVAPGGEAYTLQVEFARTEAERERGLMGRTSLASDAGMLFVFPNAVPLSFWMKDTLLPLDILFFDARGRFVSSATMTPCLPADAAAGRCAIYVSAAPAQYALEVPQGFLQRTGAGPDWVLSIGPWPPPDQ